MKKYIISGVLVAMLIVPVITKAQETDLPDPGWTPDSPFYFLERAAEAVGTFFTFGDVKKAERYANLAAERLAEAKAVAEKPFEKAQEKQAKLVEKTLERYEKQLEKAITKTEEAKNKGKETITVANIISEATQKHTAVLEEVLEKVPEQAKSAIEHAITVSNEGSERVQEAVSVGEKFEVFYAKCLESGAPKEMCQSIIVDLQSSKSFRAICTEKGGTAEICEKLPDKPFESFEEVKNFCVEMGGPTDMCSTIESNCQEFGITDPNECMLVMSIASFSTAKVVPARSLSEEEMQQQRIQVVPETQSVPAPTERGLKQRYTPGVSKVMIYTSPNCPHCAEAGAWLNQHNIEYEAINVSELQAAGKELTVRTGASGVPTIEMDGQVLIGFTKEMYSEFFGME